MRDPVSGCELLPYGDAGRGRGDPSEVHSMGKKRRSFSKEFKLEAVKLVKDGRRLSVGPGVSGSGHLRDVACAAGITQYETDHGGGPAGALTILRSRKSSVDCDGTVRTAPKMEREVLKKATAFFAKEDE